MSGPKHHLISARSFEKIDHSYHDVELKFQIFGKFRASDLGGSVNMYPQYTPCFDHEVLGDDEHVHSIRLHIHLLLWVFEASHLDTKKQSPHTARSCMREVRTWTKLFHS